MPPLPVIPGVFRVTCNWNRINGVQPVNVYHVDAGTHTVADVATTLATAYNSFSAGMFEIMPTPYFFHDIDILPLDGHTATYNKVLSSNVTGGGGSGQASPATAACLSLRTNQRGPQGRGRQYIGPVAESFMADGVLDSVKCNDMVLQWEIWKNALSVSATPCVLVVASYTHAVANAVLGISCSTVAATQRRRQDQLR
jgi:hypothetical protein